MIVPAPLLRTFSLFLIMSVPVAAEDAPPPAAKRLRKPRDSWTLQVGLAHSAQDSDHYAVSGFQARFPVFALDRKEKSERLGSIGVEIGMYPYPVISRAYVPGAGADPNTPGKYNFWEAAGLSYYTPRIGPFQLQPACLLINFYLKQILPAIRQTRRTFAQRNKIAIESQNTGVQFLLR